MNSVNIIHSWKPTHVLLLAGVNNLTEKIDKFVEGIFETVPDLVNHMYYEYYFAKRYLSRLGVHVIIGHLCGIDILAYNSFQDPKYHSCRLLDYHQSVINDSMYSVNCIITTLNADSLFMTPRLASKIHTNKKGKKSYHYYGRFKDGVHSKYDTTNDWGTVILNSSREGFIYKGILVRRNKKYSGLR